MVDEPDSDVVEIRYPDGTKKSVPTEWMRSYEVAAALEWAGITQFERMADEATPEQIQHVAATKAAFLANYLRDTGKVFCPAEAEGIPLRSRCSNCEAPLPAGAAECPFCHAVVAAASPPELSPT